MANIRVLAKLERIANELAKVRAHIVNHSGIDKTQALATDSMASSICEEAAKICQMARETTGERKPDTNRKVRKALGYVVP